MIYNGSYGEQFFFLLMEYYFEILTLSKPVLSKTIRFLMVHYRKKLYFRVISRRDFRSKNISYSTYVNFHWNFSRVMYFFFLVRRFSLINSMLKLSLKFYSNRVLTIYVRYKIIFSFFLSWNNEIKVYLTLVTSLRDSWIPCILTGRIPI